MAGSLRTEYLRFLGLEFFFGEHSLVFESPKALQLRYCVFLDRSCLRRGRGLLRGGLVLKISNLLVLHIIILPALGDFLAGVITCAASWPFSLHLVLQRLVWQLSYATASTSI